MSRIFEATADGLWVWDGKGRLIAINEQAEKYGDVSEQDIIGKHYKELISGGLYTHSAVPDILATQDEAVVKSLSARTGIMTINTGSPCLDASGKVVRVVVKERNITQLGAEPATEMIQGLLQDDPLKLGLIQLGQESIVAVNEQYRHILRTALKLAESDVTAILVLGDSGTGKGLLAKLIHQMGPRKDNPFVEINCAAVPENLLEAELFGYDPGAFTGARREGKMGLLEAAEGGTLFLDEIGDMPLNIQAKLLKYLDDFQVMRLGSTTSRKVRCAVVAATNCDLEEMVREGGFREDLLFRINAFTLEVPPLCQRPEDLCGLVTHTLEKYNEAYDKNRRVSPLLVEQLQAYSFPGNVRELKNIMKRAVVLSDSDNLDETILEAIGQAPATEEQVSLKDRLLNYERQVLLEAMTHCGSTRAMADFLGIDQSNVVRKMKKYGLSFKK